MSRAQDRGRLDWLVEIIGAVAPAAAAGFAALKLAPAYGFAVETAVLAGFAGTFGLTFATMRMVSAEPRYLPLPDFEQQTLPDDVLLLDDEYVVDELLLTVRYVEWPDLLRDTQVAEPVELTAVAELLLDDPLLAPEPDSRVVQLFAGGRMPTAGQLQRRIERHLAGAEQVPAVNKDASDVLNAALAELRRSLRQA